MFSMNSIFTRRSIRAFEDKAVEAEKIEKILRAAMQAPSAANGQPWKFIVVQGDENLLQLSKYNPYAASIQGAAFAVVVLCDNSKLVLPDMWQQDLSAVTQNILLQATELGLGSVWYGTAPDKRKMDYISELYNLDSSISPFSVVGIGYPKKADAIKFVDRFDETRIRYVD